MKASAFLFCALLLVPLASASAEVISDPTVPPPEFKPEVADMYPAADEKSAGGLQGIIVSKGASIAIINGQMLKVGDYYGDAKLIEAGNGRAVLKSSSGRQVLYLHGKKEWVTHVHKPAARQHQAVRLAVSHPILGTVIASSLKVRAEASKHAQVIGGVQRGDRVEILGQNKVWLQIRKGSLGGFVHSKFIHMSDMQQRDVAEKKER